MLAWGWELSPDGCGGTVFSEVSVTGFSAVSQPPGAPACRASPEVEGRASSAEDRSSSFRGQAGPSSGRPGSGVNCLLSRVVSHPERNPDLWTVWRENAETGRQAAIGYPEAPSRPKCSRRLGRETEALKQQSSAEG